MPQWRGDTDENYSLWVCGTQVTSDDAARFTRKWFAWQNTLFSLLSSHYSLLTCHFVATSFSLFARDPFGVQFSTFKLLE